MNTSKKQAIFEDEPQEVVTTIEILKNSLFQNPSSAKVLILEYQDQPIGFALFHDSFSTRLGTAGIHLVDLYIDEEFRGRGFGKTVLAYLGTLADPVVSNGGVMLGTKRQCNTMRTGEQK